MSGTTRHHVIPVCWDLTKVVFGGNTSQAYALMRRMLVSGGCHISIHQSACLCFRITEAHKPFIHHDFSAKEMHGS